MFCYSYLLNVLPSISEPCSEVIYPNHINQLLSCGDMTSIQLILNSEHLIKRSVSNNYYGDEKLRKSSYKCQF